MPEGINYWSFRKKVMSMGSIFMMYAISASTFFFGSQLVLYSSPLFLSGMRTFIAGALLLLYAWRTMQGALRLKKLLFTCAGIAVYSFFLSNTLKFWALQHVSTSHAALISITEPLFVVIMTYMMFGERMTLGKWIGMALCMGSGLMLALAGSAPLHIYDIFSVPTLFLCIAVASSSYGALLMRKLIRYENAPASLVMGVSMSIAGVLGLAATFTENSSCTVTADSIMLFTGNLMAMIILSNIIGYSLYGQLLKRYSALLISCGSFARPIFTSLYKWIFFNQALSVEIIGSIFILCLGLLILYKKETGQALTIKAFRID